MNTAAFTPIATLPLDEVYADSPAGTAELKRGATELSVEEIELLVRLDGLGTLRSVRADMPHLCDTEFAAAFRSLRDRKLVAAARPDALGMGLQSDVLRMALGDTRSRAERQSQALRTGGFSVGFARRREGASGGHGRPLSALVVEDEPVLARFMHCYLALEGIQARLAANRAEVVAELRKLPVPDVILLDVKLPDADGFDILAKLRAHPAFKHTPVIMLTGDSTRAAVIRGMAGGADGYMTKPFEAETLTAAVRSVLGLDDDHGAVPGFAASSGAREGRSHLALL
jgi:two-component system, OmpR family, response regulator